MDRRVRRQRRRYLNCRNRLNVIRTSHKIMIRAKLVGTLSLIAISVDVRVNQLS